MMPKNIFGKKNTHKKINNLSLVLAQNLKKLSRPLHRLSFI